MYFQLEEQKRWLRTHLNTQLIKIQTTFCSFSVSCTDNTSSSQPAWTKLIFQNMNCIISQRLFFKGRCSSFKVMGFRYTAIRIPQTLERCLASRIHSFAGVCEPKKIEKREKECRISLACHSNALSTRKLLFESVTVLLFRVMCTSQYVHVNSNPCFDRCCS